MAHYQKTKISIAANSPQEAVNEIATLIEHRGRNEQGLAALTELDDERVKATYAGDILVKLADIIRHVVIVEKT